MAKKALFLWSCNFPFTASLNITLMSLENTYIK